MFGSVRPLRVSRCGGCVIYTDCKYTFNTHSIHFCTANTHLVHIQCISNTHSIHFNAHSIHIYTVITLQDIVNIYNEIFMKTHRNRYRKSAPSPLNFGQFSAFEFWNEKIAETSFGSLLVISGSTKRNFKEISAVLILT